MQKLVKMSKVMYIIAILLTQEGTITAQCDDSLTTKDQRWCHKKPLTTNSCINTHIKHNNNKNFQAKM